MSVFYAPAVFFGPSCKRDRMHYVFGLFVRLCARWYVRARAEAYTVTSSFHRVVAQMYQPTKKMCVCEVR